MSSAHPHGVFQNGFDLVDDRGTVVAVFHGSVWRERGTISAASSTWEFGKQDGGYLRLSGPGGEVASARRTGLVDLVDAEADRCDAARAALGITPVS